MNTPSIIIIIILVIAIIGLTIILFKVNQEKDDNANSKNQFNNVLNSIQQSILLFNSENKLIFYNKHALEALHFNKDYLKLTSKEIFNNDKINDAFISQCKYKVFDINFERKIYLVHVYTIGNETTSKDNVYTIVILNNVTEARKIEQTKKDFFSHASHELKSPLTAILGYSELVSLKIVEPEEYTDIIQRIYTQALHMSLLVEDMSILSRLETIKDDMKDRRIIGLDTILNETLNTLEPFLLEKDIQLKLDVSNKLKFNCVPLDINKLFRNLIENAIKYSNSNGEISIKLKKSANKDIIFEIIDEGKIGRAHV